MVDFFLKKNGFEKVAAVRNSREQYKFKRATLLRR